MPRKPTISPKIMQLTVTLAMILMLPVSTFASGPQEGIIYHFAGLNGAAPNGSLIADDAGNLYGVTEQGGGSTNCGTRGVIAVGCGIVFKLTPPDETGGDWAESILYVFQNGADGYGPAGSLVFDRAGNLYGVSYSPTFGDQIYQLKPPASSSGSWNLNVAFDGAYGADGISGLIFDELGNLYFELGPDLDSGKVYELSPPTVAGGAWTPSLLYAFRGVAYNDGNFPMGALAIDKAGNLYGTTLEGGIVCSPSDYMGCGTIFALSPPAAGESAWTERVIHSFAGPLTDGAGPYSGIILRGNKLYGTTESGGDIGYGTVFEVSPPASPGENWTEMPIYSFNASDGSGDGPEAGVTFDPKGNLYSDTWLQPVAFELSPPIIQGNPWTYIDLYDFYDGIGEPVRGLVFEHGKLFGTAQGSGSPPNLGEVFAIIP